MRRVRTMHAAAIVAAALGVIILAAPRAMAQDAQPTWVFFKDKLPTMPHGLQQALADVAATYDAKAIQRRQIRGMGGALFDERDLPVAGSYVQQVLSIGAAMRQSSSWLNAISINANPQQLQAIAALPYVESIRSVARAAASQLTLSPTASSSAALGAATTFYGVADTQLRQIRIPEAHALGYTGRGVVIGVLDTGFKTTHAAFNQPGHALNLVEARNFVNWGTVGDSAWHGTATLGLIGGYAPNGYVGGAYNASFLLARTEDTAREVPAEEDNWVAALQWFESRGVDVASSSLGYVDWYTQAQLDGKTAVTSIAAQAAAQRGMVIVNSAGNTGHDGNAAVSHLSAPADAALVITVGAVDSNGAIASFSSDGPTADGRVKPELLAMGVGNALVSDGNDTDYTSGSGTSYSTPLVTAAVALILEAHPDWNVTDIRDALMQTASNHGTADPLYVSGYGLIDVYAAIQVPEPGSWGVIIAMLVIGCALRRRRLAA